MVAKHSLNEAHQTKSSGITDLNRKRLRFDVTSFRYQPQLTKNLRSKIKLLNPTQKVEIHKTQSFASVNESKNDEASPQMMEA